MSKKKVSSRRSAGRRKSTRKKSRVKKRGFFSGWKKALLIVFLFGTIITALYTAYLSIEVTTRFEGKRWAVPARVYGQALELYAGAPVSQQQLKAELN